MANTEGRVLNSAGVQSQPIGMTVSVGSYAEPIAINGDTCHLVQELPSFRRAHHSKSRTFHGALQHRSISIEDEKLYVDTPAGDFIFRQRYGELQFARRLIGDFDLHGSVKGPSRVKPALHRIIACRNHWERPDLERRRQSLRVCVL